MYVINGKNSIIRLVAGFLIWGSVVLSQYHHPNWLLFTGFVGIMLMVSSITGICPMEMILKKLGVREMVAVDKGKTVISVAKGNKEVEIN